MLTRIEKKQSRNEERSLLRDNHILPPKHPAPKKQTVFGRLYKRLFSTKVPRPVDDEEVPQIVVEPSETSPLLEASGSGTQHLREQWEAAVAAGQIKTTWQRESKTIAVYSRSLVVTFMLQYSINIASIFAVGHIGKEELGAISCKNSRESPFAHLLQALANSNLVATMSANITCYSFVQGLATSLDTLCAQAYGSGHRHLVGLQLQRMTIFLLILLIPIAVLWLNAESILVHLIPDPRSAELAGLYLRVILAGAPAFVCFETGKRFVQAQGLFQATTYVLMFVAPLNIFLNYLFVWRFGWGYIGAPISVVITQNLMPILLFMYVWLIDGKQCWGGFTKRAWSNWGTFEILGDATGCAH